jgi:transposase-like protein
MKKERKKKEYRSYETDFKLRVLKDMYENGLSYSFTCRKYDIISIQTLHLWEKAFPLDAKSLSLSQETIKKVMSMRKKKTDVHVRTKEEELQEENDHLRAALGYSELRNEAFLELLKIGKEEYGIDLLKKDGAKQ